METFKEPQIADNQIPWMPKYQRLGRESRGCNTLELLEELS